MISIEGEDYVTVASKVRGEAALTFAQSALSC